MLSFDFHVRFIETSLKRFNNSVLFKINVVLLDPNCTCVCTEQNLEPNTTDTLDKIAKITHGSFYEIPNTAAAIDKVWNILQLVLAS